MNHSLDAALGDRAVFESGALNLFLEAMSESVIVTNAGLDEPGPTIVFVNRACERVTGYDRKEIVGNTPRMFQGPATSRTELDRMRRALKAGRPFEGETINYRKNGEAFPLRWAVVPIYDDFGSVVAWLSLQSETAHPDGRSLEERAVAVEKRLHDKDGAK